MKTTTSAVLAAAAMIRGCVAAIVPRFRQRSRVRLAEFARRVFGTLALLIAVSSHATQTVNGITINEDLDQARRGVAYNYTIPVISGGTAPYTFALIGPSVLPIRLVLAPNGNLSGVISCNVSNGNYRQDVRVTDSSAIPIVADFTGNKGLAINVTAGPAGTCVALTITPASLPTPTAGSPYSQTITASGGLGPYTYSISAGTLPAGLTLSAATGQISGTPTSGGAYSFTVSAIDAADSTGTMAYSGTVNPAVAVNPASLPGGTVGTVYSQTVSASGGNGTLTLSLSAGALPAGLSFNAASGVISGTPSAAGTSSFTITATDGNGATGSRVYSVTISSPVTVGPSSVPGGTVGSAYSQTITASGGNGSYTYAVSSGSLPAGLALNATTGAITGTPTTAATSSFTITATDGNGATGSRSYTATINPAIVVNPAGLPSGTVGSAYSQTISATGGNGTFTYSVSVGALPAGLSLNASTGAISGTPSSVGSASFTITATDGTGAIGSRAYSVTINAAIVVNPASLPAGTVGVAYSQTVSATGGTGSYTFSVSAGVLPAGLTLNASSGVISGTPTTAGASSFTIRATDGSGAFGTRAYTITIAAAPIVVNPASLPTATVGTAYSQTVSATGGTGSYTFSVSAGVLPAGLTLNASSGVISGTPTTAGASSFTIRATDGSGAFGTRAYSVTTSAAVTVNPASLPNGTVGTAYSRTITATGGTAPYTYSVSAGTLPAGLTLNATTGVLAGTPTAAATSSFTLRATASNGAIGTRAYSVTINPAIVVNPATLPGGTLGTAYSQTVSATGGTGTYTFSRSAGTLPPGVTLNATTGVLSGTPTATGTRTFTIRATDGNGAFGTRAYTVTIGAAIVVNPATLPGGSVGSAYSRTISATGGTGTKTFSLSAGTLPVGLSLNATTGVISGTPTSAGSSSFTIRATDSIGAIGTRAYSVTINAAITLSPTTLPNGTSGTPYSRTITATGGTGTFTYSVSAGSLGGGLTLNAMTGVISGTPTTVGVRNFTIRATDGNGTFGLQAYSITINAAVRVNPTSLANGTVGTAYSRTVSATGGTGSYTFSVSAGTLPAGLTLNASSGVISGTPTTAAASSFTIRATDTLGAIGSRAYTVTIAPAPIVVSPSSLPGGAVGAAYSQVVSATGGTGGYTFSVSAGSLGTGLTLNASTGLISGTPTTSGTRNFTIRARDSSGATGTRAYSILINAAIVVNPATLAGGTTGIAYSQTITATGGNGTYTYAISAGSLPAGLTLNVSSGVISGTPTAAGTSSFTVRATDGNGASATRAYTVTIAAAPIVVNPASLPAGTVGVAYSQTVSATGGTGSYTFSVSAGVLPAGLTLNASSGVISGTPTTAAASSFTVRATDGSGAFGTRAYTITIAAAPIVVNPASLPTATVGTAYSQTVSATGGTGSYTFSVSAGVLPAGLTLNASSGVISGTPTTAGASSFTIRATDGSGAFGSRAYSVTVNAAITVNPASLPGGTVGVPYNQSVTATGGTGSHTFSVSAGSLPVGLSLNASTGAITGTPTSALASSFTITATDGNGATGSRAYNVTINAAITVNPVIAAGRYGRRRVFAIGLRDRRHGKLHVQRQRRIAAGGSVTEWLNRCNQRYACQCGDQQLYDYGHRRQRRDRIACLQHHDQCDDQRQSGDVASGDGGHSVQPDRLGHRRYRHLHLQCDGWIVAGRTYAERRDRRDHRNAFQRGDQQLHDHRDRRQRRDGLACVQRHRQSGDRGQSGVSAWRNRQCGVQPDRQCNRWQWFLHLQRLGRHIAGRPHVECVHGPDQRHDDDGGDECFHDTGCRRQRRRGNACLFSDSQCRHGGRSGHAADRDGRHRLFADARGHGRHRQLHLQRLGGQPAAGSNAQCGDGRVVWNAHHRWSERLHHHRDRWQRCHGIARLCVHRQPGAGT